jgi:hypothetical protein
MLMNIDDTSPDTPVSLFFNKVIHSSPACSRTKKKKENTSTS